MWAVEKVIYALNDFVLPFPVTLSQMSWLVVSLLTIAMLSKIPPIVLITNPLLKFVALPAGITWFMSQKALDGKKPIGFLKSVIMYIMRPKITYAGKKVTLHNKQCVQPNITIVRRNRIHEISH